MKQNESPRKMRDEHGHNFFGCQSSLSWMVSMYGTGGTIGLGS